MLRSWKTSRKTGLFALRAREPSASASSAPRIEPGGWRTSPISLRVPSRERYHVSPRRARSSDWGEVSTTALARRRSVPRDLSAVRCLRSRPKTRACSRRESPQRTCSGCRRRPLGASKSRQRRGACLDCCLATRPSRTHADRPLGIVSAIARPRCWKCCAPEDARSTPRSTSLSHESRHCSARMKSSLA